MTSGKNIKFFGLTIALISTRGSTISKTLVKLPEKLVLPKSKPGNFLVCPLSVEMLLALTLTGARENTAKEMANALLLPKKPERIQQAFQELSNTFKGNESYNLETTSKIYIQVGSNINEEFKEIATSSFNAEIENINFKDKTHAAFEINKWVAKRTDDKITHVVKIDFMDENIRMAIINTVYFNGRSVKEFNRATSGSKRFFINKSDYVDISMLESVGFFNYSTNSKLRAKLLEVPYEGNDIIATLVLPDDRTGLAGLENRIEDIFSLPSYKNEPVHVRIPKFTITTGVHFTDILQGLGVKDAFQDNANFSGILQTGEPLKITSVIHKSFIDGVEFKKSSKDGKRALDVRTTPSSLDSPHKFYVDHPFVFYLKHKRTGVFFIGRMYRVDGIIKNSPVIADNNIPIDVKLK